ncbi:hypothetical protein GQ42DRAFT_163047 [Ramicandelaber brevisporus]|nr:hypothetical protein GQ42DRAFT_163047 [Ramicandelaber brevisporus]
MTVPVPTAPLRFLCLHGHAQNATIFYGRTGAFRKAFKSTAEFTFANAPHAIPIDTPQHDGGEVTQSSQPLSWCEKLPDGTVYGLDAAMDSLADVLKEQGPFDGLLAYSQGASIGVLLAAILENPAAAKAKLQSTPASTPTPASASDSSASSVAAVNGKPAPGGVYLKRDSELRNSRILDTTHPPFKVALLFCSGGPATNASLNPLFSDGRIQCPSLHVLGRQDAVVPNERSEMLLQFFEKPETLYHDGGHFVPGQSSITRQIKDFLSKNKA